MTSADFRARPEFIQGRNGEQLVAEFLKAKGYYVIPSYDYSGEDNNKAPKLQGLRLAYVIPDLDVCREGLRRWVEVKTKTEATYYRKKKELQHGIDKRHFEQYQIVQAETGCEVSLGIYELNPRPVLLIASIDDLNEYLCHEATSSDGSRMLYWDRHVFYCYEL